MIPAENITAWWQAFGHRHPDVVEPFDRAALAGFSSDRVAGAFAGGYQAALRALVPSLPPDAIASFCVTEAGGNQPRAIDTTLAPADSGFVVNGAKRWSTMAPVASVLFVVASEGTDDGGRKRLRLVRVDTSAAGVKMGSMPATKFVPEIPHGAIELEAVTVDAGAVFAGDAYERHVKPFRTVEDLHIHGAVLGYLISVARRFAWSEESIERLTASVVATRGLAALDASAPDVHVALAGLLAQDAELLRNLAPSWASVDAAERERWERDSERFGSVAGQIRELRRRRAWEAVSDASRTSELGGYKQIH